MSVMVQLLSNTLFGSINRYEIDGKINNFLKILSTTDDCLMYTCLCETTDAGAVWSIWILLGSRGKQKETIVNIFPLSFVFFF